MATVTALNVTVGDPNMNAYVSIAAADQYHANRPDPDGLNTWGSANSTAKTQAILWATQLLDAIYVWTGWAAVAGQPLLWPRQAMFYRDNWTIVPYTIIPVQLQYAAAEYARQLLIADRAGDVDLETQRITNVKAGSVSVSFGAGVTSKPVPDAVYYMIPVSWGYPRARTQGSRESLRS